MSPWAVCIWRSCNTLQVSRLHSIHVQAELCNMANEVPRGLLRGHKRSLLAPAWMLLSRRMPSRAQAGLSGTADREQEAYRSYLLQRLLPPMAARFGDIDMDADGFLRLTSHSVKQSLEACPTSTLEGRLEEFHEGLLEVRVADVLNTSVSVHGKCLYV